MLRKKKYITIKKKPLIFQKLGFVRVAAIPLMENMSSEKRGGRKINDNLI